MMLHFTRSKIIAQQTANFCCRKRQPEGPLHKDDRPRGRSAAARRGFPGHAEGASFQRHFRCRQWRPRGQEFKVVGTRPVRPVPRFPRARTIRATFSERRVLRYLPERKPRHGKRRRVVQSPSARQKGPPSEGKFFQITLSDAFPTFFVQWPFDAWNLVHKF